MNLKVIITMAMRIIIKLTIIFLVIISCQNTDNCVGVAPTNYEGKGQVFFHKPTSGSSYEFIYIPVCKTNFNGELELNSDKLFPGISFTVTSDLPLTKAILGAATRLSLDSNTNLAEHFKEVYVCPIYLRVEGIANDTKIITGHQFENIRKEMIIENKKLVITYFYSDYPKIKAFEILR
jgi:hypothetical protein